MPRSQFRATLKLLQAELSAAAGRPLSQAEIAQIAETTPRALAEWMRGATSPASAQAILRLLAEIPTKDLRRILRPWNRRRVKALSGEERARIREIAVAARDAKPRPPIHQKRIGMRGDGR